MEQSEFDLLIKKNGSKNLSWNTNRLKFDSKDIENALSKGWQKENKKRPAINYGWGILQDLFFERIYQKAGMYNDYCRLKITNRDRFVAATVIQWLGTNVGFCWLRESLDKVGYKIVKKE